MIIKNLCCPKCKSDNLSKNGKSSNGKQKFYCKTCKSYGVLNSSRRSNEEKEEILNAYKERSSLRGLQRIYKVSPNSIIRWIKKKSN